MKKVTLLFLILTFSKMFSQATPVNIVDSAANYSGNIEYNVGEVFVVYTVAGNTIVSKQGEEENNNISENNVEKIYIVPNPGIEIVNIIVPKGKIVNNIFLYNIDGRIIMSKEISSNQIDLSNLPSGTYLLKTNLSDTETFKIIKK